MKRGIKERLLSPFAVFSQIFFFYIVSLLLGYFWYIQTGKALYFSYLFLAEILTMARPRDRVIQKMIRTGNIAPFLVRPSSLFFQFLPYYAGKFFFDVFVYFSASIPIFLFFGFPSPIFFLLLPSVFLIMYCLYFSFEVLAFRFGQVAPFRHVIDKLLLFAGGTIIPLNMSIPFKGMINLLPFKYMVYAPVALSLGLSASFLGILFWSLVLLFIAIFMEKWMVKYYEVGGG